MKKKPKTTYKALRNKILLITLTLWFLSMFLLTWAVGADFYNQLEGNIEDWRQTAMEISKHPHAVSGSLEHAMLERLRFSYLCFEVEPLLPIMRSTGFYGSYDNNELGYGFQAAMAYYDTEGNTLFTSGDYLYFSYYEDEQLYYAYIDLEALEGGKELADQYISSNPWGDLSPFTMADLQMTGYFEGNQFFPVTITALYDGGTERICYNRETGVEDLRHIYVYQENLDGYNYEPGIGFFLNGKYYDSPLPLLDEDDLESKFSLFSAVIQTGTGTRAGGSVELIIYCRPIIYAMLRLYWVYLLSLELVLIVVFIMLRRIRRDMTEPLMVMVRSYEQNRAELSPFGRSPLADLKLLGEHFDYAQQERHKAENEVQQLRTALNYAQNAEESRRKMVSAIAHELKTPLAVIHSYAEGLQEGIAPEKQEKYLSVILSEAQQMDALVQQMLDLSRLEAGKITLNTDQVDLAALTREVFEKLSLAAEARQLQVEMDLAELSVVADEARIGQVITNFASNAVKYTTQGGTIRVRLQREDKYARFSIENDAPHFSDEALEQVWETFYRADTARDRSGTGLGLAIAKNIIELHRGSCRVRNTKHGVEFSFRIPM